MQELLLIIVFDLEDELGDPEQYEETVYDGFIEYLKNDPGFTQQDVETEVGHHVFPDGDALLVIQGKVKSWSDVDYINHKENRDGLEADLQQAATSNLEGSFLDQCDVQTNVMVEPQVTEAELQAGLDEVEV